MSGVRERSMEDECWQKGGIDGRESIVKEMSKRASESNGMRELVGEGGVDDDVFDQDVDFDSFLAR